MSARVMILNFLSCKNHLCFLATFYYRVVFTSVSENALACSLQGQPSYWEVCSNVSTCGPIAMVLPFRWTHFSSTFLYNYLFVGISQREKLIIWILLWIFSLAAKKESKGYFRLLWGRLKLISWCIGLLWTVSSRRNLF